MSEYEDCAICEQHIYPGEKRIDIPKGGGFHDVVHAGCVRRAERVLSSSTPGCPESVRCADRFELCPPQCHPSSIPSGGQS